jgi:hypothetical protein
MLGIGRDNKLNKFLDVKPPKLLCCERYDKFNHL